MPTPVERIREAASNLESCGRLCGGECSRCQRERVLMDAITAALEAEREMRWAWAKMIVPSFYGEPDHAEAVATLNRHLGGE